MIVCSIENDGNTAFHQPRGNIETLVLLVMFYFDHNFSHFGIALNI
jgi:hypothetical protein